MHKIANRNDEQDISRILWHAKAIYTVHKCTEEVIRAAEG